MVEILTIALPVMLGALVWAGQTLAQRAWNDYEQRRDIYLDVTQLIDSLFTSGDTADRRAYLRAIRQIWLVGSDEAIRSANHFHTAMRNREPDSQLEVKYQRFISAMRQDIRKRRWLPPRNTTLGPANFPLEGPSQ